MLEDKRMTSTLLTKFFAKKRKCCKGVPGIYGDREESGSQAGIIK
jgi:hypothetical protein